jgi:tetratricopeptide (TPR) repeat protein
LELSRKAYAHLDRLTDRERFAVQAYYYRYVEADREQTIATYRRMLERYPNNRTALNNLGNELIHQRRWEEAEELFRRARANAVSQGVYMVSYSNILQPQFILNDTAAIDSSLRMIEAFRPDLALLWQSRLAAARRDYDAAWEGFEQLAQRDPESIDGWDNLQLIASVRGQLGVAAELSHRVRAICQQQNEHYCLITAAYHLARMEALYRGSTSEAVRLLNSAVNRHLDSVPASQRSVLLRDAATWYAILGQASVAAEYLAAYRRENPEEVRRIDRERYQAVGWVALAGGQFEQATRAFRAWHEALPNRTCGLYELAVTFDRMGNLDSAVVVYERAVTTPFWMKLSWEWDWLPVAYRRLGELYEQRGDHENAVRYYNEFVELWKDADRELQPQVEDVRRRIARLMAEPRH